MTVAAASVIAKVRRDNLMAELGGRMTSSRSKRTRDTHRPPTNNALARLGPTPYHRLSWAYLDDLPKWRHLKKTRPEPEGQLSLL